jgi:acetolactate synthase-1/2/3 large subunit
MATCGEAAIRLLEQYDVDVVFGIPGVHTLEYYRGLADSPIRHVTPRHEQGAGYMACGYTRVTGRPGVCILITGAGLSNAATAIATAHHDSLPLLILSSGTATADAGRDHGPLHDLPDQRAFMEAICALSIDVREPAELPEAFARAFEVLQAGRPRPVHISVPVDVLPLPAADDRRLPDRSESPVPNAAALGAAADRLAAAERPLLLLGGGACSAAAEAIALAERLGAPATMTIAAKGVVPDAHPLSLGTSTTLAPVFDELASADVVLAVGTEFSETDYFYTPSLAAPRFGGDLIRLDIDAAQLQRQRPAAIGLHGEARRTLVALDAALAERGVAGDGAARAAALRDAIDWTAVVGGFGPFLDALAAGLPDAGVLAVDSTQPAYAAAHSWRGTRPNAYLPYGGFGTLGPALPMAIGARLGAPDRPVAALAGDGGLLFTIQELATAADLGLPIALVVWQNRGYGEIRDSMERADVPPVAVDTSAHDFPRIAEGFGCRGVRAGAVDELPALLADAFAADRPTLIEVLAPGVAPSVLPVR